MDKNNFSGLHITENKNAKFIYTSYKIEYEAIKENVFKIRDIKIRNNSSFSFVIICLSIPMNDEICCHTQHDNNKRVEIQHIAEFRF